MKITQQFASDNRRVMAQVLIEGFFKKKFSACSVTESVHNYVDFTDRVIRKGAISASKDKTVVIPMNMRDGSIVARGKGNAEWNFSAPHGAGRLLSRGSAKEIISMAEYTQAMKGIYSSSVNESTLDESPMVYKPMEEITSRIGDTVEILSVLKPLYITIKQGVDPCFIQLIIKIQLSYFYNLFAVFEAEGDFLLPLISCSILRVKLNLDGCWTG